VTAATRTCEVCSVPIDHLRRDAKVCSASCRGMKSRGDVWLPAGRCQECDKRLAAGSRADARFCSGKCRTTAGARRASLTATRASEVKEIPPGAKRLLRALVRRGLAEQYLHAAARLVLALDEGAGR
jgi:predicted nucleic acid-binding Zn ribbon protein